MTQPKSIVFVALLAAAVVQLLPANASAQATAVTIQPGFVVDRGTGIRRGTAIAVDSKNVYFAYYYIGDQPSGARGPELMYEAFPLVLSCPPHVLCGFEPPSPQPVDVLTPTPGSSLFAYTVSIALDPQGNPHIFYQDGQGGMRHATIDPIAGWVHETVPLAAGLYSSMAIDSSGTIHVADGPISPSGIGYATKTNGIWTTDTIIGPSNGMAGLSLAVDSQGTPQVVWADNRSSFNEVVYARRGTGAIPWSSGNFEVISGDKAYWVSLAVDAQDVPSVSYWGWTDSSALASRLIYATKQSFGFWPLQLVDSSIIPCCITFPWDYQMTSLGVSPLGTPRIIYGFDHSNSDAGVAFARLDGPSWNIESLDQDPLSLVSQATALVMDSSDIAHVLYIANSCPPVGFCNDALVYERIATANTLTTGNTVNLGDPAGSGSPITVTFTQVTQNGLTSVTLDDTSTGPAPPANFQLGNPPVYYDFSTTAGFTASIQVCIPYGNVGNPSGVVLMHFENGAWVDRTVSNDTVLHIVCASVSSLSPFAAFESQTVTQSPTSLVLSSSVNSSTFGQNVTFTASLTATGSAAPSGTVTLLDGATPLGPAVTLAGGTTATFLSSSLTVGTHSITAQYSGDSNYTASTSSAVVQVVNKNGTAVALNGSPNPSTAGQLVTFGSSVIGVSPPPGVPAPTGSVTFLDGATALGPAVPVAIDGSSAFTISSLTAGTHTITAQYSGDADWGASTSSAVTQVVNANFSTSILLNAAATTYGTPVSVTVSVGSPGGTVSGSVTLSLDGATASSMTLSNGSAVFNLGVLNAGPHLLSASFAGQGSFSASSATGPLSVAQAALTVTANNATRSYGSPNPAFSGNISGIQNGDNITAIYGSAATPASPVGSYDITSTLSDPGNKLSNYTVTRNRGTLTITAVTVTISANNATKTLSAPNPTLNWTASGFVNGDNGSVLTTNPTCNTTAGITSPIGSYAINCSGANAANYTFSYAPGVLKIVYAPNVGHVIQAPINADGTSVFNQGRTVPAKFSVYDANGVSIGTAGVVSSFYLTGIMSGTTSTTVENVVDTNNPDTYFRWDPTSQQWIFNITTGNLTAGSTYVYTIALNDGSTIVFQYGLR